jgi:hypothetical protein
MLKRLIKKSKEGENTDIVAVIFNDSRMTRTGYLPAIRKFISYGGLILEYISREKAKVFSDAGITEWEAYVDAPAIMKIEGGKVTILNE